jgi:hypothetical protein
MHQLSKRQLKDLETHASNVLYFAQSANANRFTFLQRPAFWPEQRQAESIIKILMLIL